jgi:hypothetical protein
VAEWCWDRYAPYPLGAQIDPAGADSSVWGNDRVTRGGFWGSVRPFLRSALRGRGSPGSSTSNSGVNGFRLVRLYKVGEIGPAGGIVFYDRGFTADGWRYLEAAPTDFVALWAPYLGEVNIPGTDTAIGSGRENTRLIIDEIKHLSKLDYAAKICAAMNVNGYTDWFLPSRDELALMYTNLRQEGLGGGFSNAWYWSSSQLDSRFTVIQHFLNGEHHYGDKYEIHSVRAIRSF